MIPQTVVTSQSLLFPFFMTIALCSCSKKTPSWHTSMQAPEHVEHSEADASIDAGLLLTSEEIRAVIGEPVQDSVRSNRAETGFLVSQCYFGVTTPSNSVVLTVTSPGTGADRRDPRQFWMEKFHPGSDTEKENEALEEHRKQTPPEPVSGLGEEAYWVESGSTGALYVLQGNNFMRVAVGGTDEKPARVEKSKSLAQFALKRLVGR